MMSTFADPAPVVVQKYGGSSVADVDRLRQVARRVVQTVRTGRRVVVVVSAMGNTTNELLALAHRVSQQPGRRELDLLVSVGERVSMTLLAMAIEDHGVPAASFTGSQSGIITDERHVSAQVIEVRAWRIQRALDQGKVAIVAGFQGVSRAGEVTTLGRGGSDTTAVVLAAALGAEHCEICSDVDGVYSADPRVVPGARLLKELTLDAASALAFAGARVLQAEAVAHAQRLGVRLAASSTARPPGSGTILPPGPVPDGVVAVASDERVEHLIIDEWRAGMPPVKHAWSDGKRIHALVDLRDLPDGGAAVAEADRVGVVATVSLIGRSAATDPGTLHRALRVLASAGGGPWFSSLGGWTGVVPIASMPAALAELHEIVEIPECI